jgi:hypothetical protein
LLLGQSLGEDQRHQNHYADDDHFEDDGDGSGSSPLGLQLATGFQKAIFKHDAFS